MHLSVIVGKYTHHRRFAWQIWPTNWRSNSNFRAFARKLTYALAASFQEYSKRVKETEQREQNGDNSAAPVKKKFAIDLRTPEEMQQSAEDRETEA